MEGSPLKGGKKISPRLEKLSIAEIAIEEGLVRAYLQVADGDVLTQVLGGHPQFLVEDWQPLHALV